MQWLTSAQITHTTSCSEEKEEPEEALPNEVRIRDPFEISACHGQIANILEVKISSTVSQRILVQIRYGCPCDHLSLIPIHRWICHISEVKQLDRSDSETLEMGRGLEVNGNGRREKRRVYVYCTHVLTQRANCELPLPQCFSLYDKS